jgi:hypothetical protein
MPLRKENISELKKEKGRKEAKLKAGNEMKNEKSGETEKNISVNCF